MVSTNMTIEERQGPRRKIILRGRSLPFQGVDFGTMQRSELDYFVGNPVGSLQFMGPVWKPTTMEGRWSDLYLIDDENAPTLINFPALNFAELTRNTFTSGGTSGERARTAESLRDAFYTICRSGMLLKMQWGTIVRFGHIEEFTPIVDLRTDMSWEMRWKWSGDRETQPQEAPRSKDLTSVLQRIVNFAKDVLKTLRLAQFTAEFWQRRITGTFNELGQYVTDLLGTMQRLAKFALAPSELLGNIKATLKGIQIAADDLMSVFSEASMSIVSSVGGDPSQVNYDNAIQSAVRKLLQRLSAEGRIAQDDVDKTQAPTIKATTTIKQGTSLRDLSIEYYGTAKNWQAIQEFNTLQGSIVPAGTSVRVPNI